MPEDFNSLWYEWNQLKKEYNKYWQDMGPPYTYLTDRDLWCTYCMMSI